MRLILLTSLTMIAFAANSVLNRMALAGGHIDPASFALVRLGAGALILAFLVWRRGGVSPAPRVTSRPWGALALTLYMLGFSFAYLGLDAGVGALILFGGVQITMFAGALITGEDVPARRWAGAMIAFGGLVWLLWPGAGVQISLFHAGLMGMAALGWGLYSLIGRGATDPLAETGMNFIWASLLAVLVFLLARTSPVADAQGLMLAVISGALTSGLGYALWYTVLPRLGATRAATAQLTVPLIAVAGGMVFLAEGLSLRFAIAAMLVLGGIALSLLAPRQA